jgi:hypothetical protein
MAVPLSLASLPLQITVGALCASYWRGAWYILDYTLFPNDRLTSSISSLGIGSSLLAAKQYILSPSYNGTKQLVRWLPPPSNYSLRVYYVKMNRFVSLYFIAFSCVLVWRGAWLLWDEAADYASDVIVKTTASESSSSAIKANPIEMAKSSKASTTTTKTNQDQQSGSLHAHHHADHDAVSHHDIDKTLFYSGIVSHVFATAGLLLLGRFKSVMAPPANVSMMKDIFLHGKGREFANAARSFSKPR